MSIQLDPIKPDAGYRNQKLCCYCNKCIWVDDSRNEEKDTSRKLKFIHSELVIALIALEFLSSWIARDYF